MSYSGIRTFHINEGTSPTILLRIWGHDGAGITQAGTSSIDWACYEVDEDAEADETGTAIASGTLDVSSTVFDTYQTDARWTEDTTGYNFLFAAPATIAPTGNTLYQVQFTFTPTTGGVIKSAIRLKTRPFWGE